MIAAPVAKPLTSQPSGAGRIGTWLMGIVSIGLLALLFLQVASQIVASPQPRFVIVNDVPLPGVLPARFIPNVRNAPAVEDPLAPGVSVRLDHFDFQALDPRTKLLFIAHTGPSPDAVPFFISPRFDPAKDSQIDGHVIVFDTQQKKVIGRVDIPQIAGLVAAPDLGRVFAGDAQDDIVYSIDEHTLKATPIQLDSLEGPDAMEYDPEDHKVFVSDPGTPPGTAPNVSLNNENIAVIDTRTNRVTKINLGHLPKLPNEHAELTKWGYDVGHNKYDPALRRVFVVTQQLTDQSAVNPPLPPLGTSELVSINPVTERVVQRLQLPTTCSTPHGMSLDPQEHIAFIACTDVDPAQNLVQNLLRVDLRTMTVLPDPLLPLAFGPDIVVFDHSLHVLFVACVAGISVFDVHGRTVKKLGDYLVGKQGTHTLAVDEQTQTMYLPLPNVGGRPMLRIARYDPNGQ